MEYLKKKKIIVFIIECCVIITCHGNVIILDTEIQNKRLDCFLWLVNRVNNYTGYQIRLRKKVQGIGHTQPNLTQQVRLGVANVPVSVHIRCGRCQCDRCLPPSRKKYIQINPIILCSIIINCLHKNCYSKLFKIFNLQELIEAYFLKINQMVSMGRIGVQASIRTP